MRERERWKQKVTVQPGAGGRKWESAGTVAISATGRAANAFQPLCLISTWLPYGTISRLSTPETTLPHKLHQTSYPTPKMNLWVPAGRTVFQ